MFLILVSTVCFILETQKAYTNAAEGVTSLECCWRADTSGNLKFMLPNVDVFDANGFQVLDDVVMDEARYYTPSCSCTTEGLGTVAALDGAYTCVEATCQFFKAGSMNMSHYQWHEPACICEPQPMPIFKVRG